MKIKYGSVISMLLVSMILFASPVLSKALTVRSNATETGVIEGATIYSGGDLMLTGISKGELVVKRGGNLFVSGVADGGITNDGGTVEVTGVASFVFANAGTTTIRGIVKAVKGNGKVKYIKGAIIGGKEIK